MLSIQGIPEEQRSLSILPFVLCIARLYKSYDAPPSCLGVVSSTARPVLRTYPSLRFLARPSRARSIFVL